MPQEIQKMHYNKGEIFQDTYIRSAIHFIARWLGLYNPEPRTEEPSKVYIAYETIDKNGKLIYTAMESTTETVIDILSTGQLHTITENIQLCQDMSEV